ncbi:Competence protein A [Polystyrenella longa]|uniref:Competence protein A n=1 Tax=Polystyrenella longa TaxID=2528007 RepID=A0A518CRP8_9PLAN|nr:pilus assembly protein PilM [Polystyrenella longa]QDU81888.1 Competence protein A [Polystyrenella longa]
MFLTSSLLAPFKGRQFAPLRSWLGVDIGRSALKLAEVEQENDVWKISQMQFASVCNSGLWQEKHLSTSVLSAELSKMVSLSTGWKNRQAAAVVSLSATDYRTVNLPESSLDEYEEMIHQELVSELQEDVIFDFWEPEEELSDSTDEVTSLIVYALANSNSTAVGKALERASLNCRVLDGLPFSLARAIIMADPMARHQTTVAIDWGYSAATLVFLKQGNPFYTRVLRGCQFQVFLQDLSKELGLSEQQCWNLLCSMLSNESRSAEFQSALNKRLQPVIDQYINLVQKEVNRTVQYIQSNTRLPEWNHIWLFGGGALFRQVYEPLAIPLKISVKPWSLRLTDTLDTPLHQNLVPLFGPAASLASLRRWK